MEIVKTEKLIVTREEYNAWIIVFNIARKIKVSSEITELKESADRISDLMDTIDNYITVKHS